MDIAVFNALHSLAGQSGWGDALIIFFAEWYLWIVLLIVCVVAWRERGVTMRLYPYAVAIFAALAARFGVAEIIRLAYHRERPYVALGISHLINDSASSFPSGHTIFLFALGAAVHFVNKKLAYFIYASGLVIGCARVAAGVHYPSDIVGGMVLGVATGAGVYWIASKIFAVSSN